MPEHDGAPTTHEVEIFAAVDIPEVTTFAAGEELRISLGQPAGPHVAIHAAGHDQVGAITQTVIDGAERGCHQFSRPRVARGYMIYFQ